MLLVSLLIFICIFLGSCRYKTPDEKPLNQFGFDEKYLNASEAKRVIAETNESWKKLRSGLAKAGKLWTGATAEVK